jgi:hypothetical protein
MKIKYLGLVIASAFAGSAAMAQEMAVAANPALSTSTDQIDAYSLKGGNLSSPGSSVISPNQEAVSPSYALKVTGFGGSKGSQEVIRTAPVPERGAPIKTEAGIWFYPSVTAGLGYNDNVLGDPTNRKGSSLLNVAPEVVAEMKRRGDRYTASYSGNFTRYASSQEDNYSNHEAFLAGDNYFSQRARMGWSLGYVTGSDARGSTNRAISDKPDRWSATILDGTFIYGAPSARGRFEFDAKHMSKEYDNNRINTALSDLDQTGLAGRFLFRVGSRSSVLAEMRQSDNDYKSSLSTQDNTDRRYYLGYTWEATAATTGIFKLGRMTKKFDNAGLQNYSGTSWEGTVRWLPRTYSAFDAQIVQEAGDSTGGLGSYVLNRGNNLMWNHKWTSYTTSRLSLGQLKSDYVGALRTDRTSTFGAMLTYDVLRWMSIGADFSRTDRQSNDPNFEFKRNVLMFTLNATL